MIGADRVDQSSPQTLPEPLSVFALADWRCALEPRVAVGNLLGREDEIVRAGLDEERQPFVARLRDHRQGIGRREMHDVDAAAGLAAKLDQEPDRLVLPLARPRREIAGVAAGFVRTSRAVPAAPSPTNSAWTRSGSPARASSGIAALRSLSPAFGNSSMPEWQRNALNPATPGVGECPDLPANAGHDSPVKPAIDAQLAAGGLSLSSSASVVVVTGELLSGMSKSEVIPPAAAARVAVSNPSHSVRPGSLMCT